MIEETLRDAFDAAARTVQPETLRPLDAPAGSRAARRWPVPVIAAASVAVVVTGSVAVAGRDAAPAQPGRYPDGMPRFFVTSELGDGAGAPGTLQVHDSLTGKVRDTAAAPARGMSFSGVSAAGDGRTFIATAKPNDQLGASEGMPPKIPDDCRVRTYRLRITGSGKISELSPVKGGGQIRIEQQPYGSVAVSRDGKKIAYSGRSCVRGDHRYKIVVWNTSTGARREWIDPATSNIMNMSWAADGRHLAYVRAEMAPAKGAPSRGHDAMFLLDTAAAPGDPLAASRLLLRLPDRPHISITQIAVPPGGSRTFALTRPPLQPPGSGGNRVEVGKGNKVKVFTSGQITRPQTVPPREPMSLVEIAGGRVVRTLHRWKDQAAFGIGNRMLKLDASGRHLLVLRGENNRPQQLLRVNDGVIHRLAGGGRTYDMAW